MRIELTKEQVAQLRKSADRGYPDLAIEVKDDGSAVLYSVKTCDGPPECESRKARGMHFARTEDVRD